MTIKNIDLSQLLDYWSQQRDSYGPSAYALLLCGDATELDRRAFDFVVENNAMLDDMSGPYVSLTLLGWRLDVQDNASAIADEHLGELEYLHATHSWTFGSPGVYSLVNALDLPLNQLPLVVLSTDPWAREDVLIISLRDGVSWQESTEDRSEQLADFFATLFTTCRSNRDLTPEKRLRVIRKHVKENIKKGENTILKEVIGSGIFAQLIEGIVNALKS